MSIDNVSSSSSSRPVSGTGADSAVDRSEKESPSSFDRVLEDKKELDEKSKKPADTRDYRRDLKKGDKDVSLKDVPGMFSLRARTLERSSGTGAVSGEMRLPRKVIDEVVQAVRVGVNRTGDKEVSFDMKSTVMDGMSVRVSMHENKVVTTLEVTTLDAKNQLEANLADLKQSLVQKGLDVAEIQVQFKEEETRSYQQDSSRQQHQEQDDSEDPHGSQ
jgi:hypothetical protein